MREHPAPCGTNSSPHRVKSNRRPRPAVALVATLSLLATLGLLAGCAADPAATVEQISPTNMASDGILITAEGPVSTPAIDGDPIPTDPANLTAPANIVLYADYACPACAAFELTNSEQIATWVATGEATLEIHPLTFLDRVSAGSRYSSRAANAVAAVASYAPEHYLAVSTALFEQQPSEGVAGHTNDELLTIIEDAGVDPTLIADAVEDERFSDWTFAATERAFTGPIPNADISIIDSTPTVIVNGTTYSGGITSPDEFAEFVASVSN